MKRKKEKKQEKKSQANVNCRESEIDSAASINRSLSIGSIVTQGRTAQNMCFQAFSYVFVIRHRASARFYRFYCSFTVYIDNSAKKFNTSISPHWAN